MSDSSASRLKQAAVAAGFLNTLLLRSDGQAIVVGNNSFGQRKIPAPAPGTAYTGGTTGQGYAVLLFGQTPVSV